jgi:Holliday junction resolvase RusA-like endonuclease
MRKRKLKVMTGPMAVSINIVRETPRSWSKKKTAAARWVTGKPDLDNSAKLLLDAVRGIIMRDDDQVAVLNIERRYNNEGGGEHVIAAFRELEAA